MYAESPGDQRSDLLGVTFADLKTIFFAPVTGNLGKSIGSMYVPVFDYT